MELFGVILLTTNNEDFISRAFMGKEKGFHRGAKNLKKSLFLLKIFPTINSGFYYVRAFSVLLVSMHLNTTYLVSASGASRALVRAATGLVYLIISR